MRDDALVISSLCRPMVCVCLACLFEVSREVYWSYSELPISSITRETLHIYVANNSV